MGEDAETPKNLDGMLDQLEELAGSSDKVSVDEVMDAAGHRSFGPLLLVVGVFAAAPGLADIPGVASVLGLLVLIVSVQLLFGRTNFWLPKWLLDRKISGETLQKMTSSKWMRRLAKWTDKVVKERLEMFTGPKARYAIAFACTLMALALPVTEVVPMGTNGVSLGLVAFGLSMIARDGVMALVGFLISQTMLALLGWGIT